MLTVYSSTVAQPLNDVIFGCIRCFYISKINISLMTPASDAEYAMKDIGWNSNEAACLGKQVCPNFWRGWIFKLLLEKILLLLLHTELVIGIWHWKQI